MPAPYSLTDFVKIVCNFKPKKDSSNVEKIEQYKQLFTLLDNQASIFYLIHDFSTYRYIMVSKSVKNITGIDNDILLENDFGYMLKHYIHPDDGKNLRHIHEKIFEAFYKEPLAERYKLRFDFNYRFKKATGEWQHLLQQSIFIIFTDEGNPLYDFTTCTDISPQKKNNSMELTVYKQNDKGMYEVVSEFSMPEHPSFGLTKRELEIMKCIAEGMSSKEVADNFSLSLHTVSSHRKNILSKTGAKNFSEAIVKVNI